MKATQLLVLILFVGLAHDSATVKADVEIEEIDEQTPNQGSDQATPEKKPKSTKKKLTSEDINRLKQEKKAQKDKMQSCLTLLRSYYAVNREKIMAYIDNHKAVTHPDTKSSSKDNTHMLASKLQAQMLIKCEKQINDEQIKELQKFKNNFEKFDYTRKGYREMIELDFTAFDVKEESESGHSITLTNAEHAMLGQIEDISESLSKEAQQQNIQSSKGAVNIAFFDISKMSGPMQAVYLLLIFSGLGAVAYWFY